VPSLYSVDNATAWRHLASQQSGGFKNIHPAMKREGIYILGTPHLLYFANGIPIRVVRLHSSSARNLNGEFNNRRVGPWLTCRILDRAGFDTSNLIYFVINYSRDTYNETNPQLIADIEQTVATATRADDLGAALEPWNDVYVFGRHYDRHEFVPSLNRWTDIWTEKKEPSGTENLEKCRNCIHRHDCPDSLA
jgi:hypothetical protein